MNPWQSVPLDAYEGHMRLDEVYQLQTLDALVKTRFDLYAPRSVAIWGIAGGNGLAHIKPEKVDLVVGVDINADYLAAVKARYAHLGEKLVCVRADLAKPARLPYAALLIADLFIEYIGVDAFCARVSEAAPDILCLIIQKNNAAAFVSTSPYMEALSGIGALHEDIGESVLTAALAGSGYRVRYREEIPVKNGKSFVRIDLEMGEAG